MEEEASVGEAVPQPVREVDGQGALADAAHAVDRLDGHDVVRGAPLLAERGGEPPQLLAPPGPGDVARQVVRDPARGPGGRSLLGRGAGEQDGGGGSGQDALVDPVQPAPGVESDVLHDPLPRPLEQPGGLGRPVAAVQGDGQPLGQRLVHGARLDQRQQHGYGVGVLPAVEQDLGPGQRGHQPGLAGGRAQMLGPGAGDAGQRLPVPVVLRPVQQAQGALGVAAVPEGAGPLDAGGVAAQVDPVRVGLQGVQVGAAAERGRVLPEGPQGGADAGDVRVQRLPGLAGRVVVPDAVDQGVHTHRTAGVPGEGGERDPRLRRPQIAASARRTEFHGPRNPDLELHQRPPRR